MADRFDALMSNIKDMSERVSSGTLPKEEYPKFQQFLKNARNLALEHISEKEIEPKQPFEMTPERLKDLNELSQLLSLHSSIVPTLVSSAKRNIVAENSPVNRQDLRNEMAMAYLEKTDPTLANNIKHGTEYDKEGLPLSQYEPDLIRAQKSVIKKLTGQDVNVEKLTPNDYEYENNAGVYYPKENVIKIKNLADFATGTHEALHQVYRGQEVPEEESQKDLSKTQDLVNTVRDINREHIPYNIEGKETPSASEGDVGYWYDKLKGEQNPQQTSQKPVEPTLYADGGQVMNFDDLVDDSHVQPVATPQGEAIPDFDSLTDDSEQYKTLPQQAIGAVEAAGRGALGALMPMFEKSVGISPESMLGREHALGPIVSKGAEAAGFLTSLVTGTGEAAAMAKAGELAAGLTKAGEVANVAKEMALAAGKTTEEAAKLGTEAFKAMPYTSRVGSSAVQQAAEMAVMGSSDQVAHMVMQDPETTSESAIANIGMAAALGAAGGAIGTGIVSPLWSATVGPKVESLLGTLTAKVGGSEGTASLASELAQKSGVPMPAEVAAKVDGSPLGSEIFSELSQKDTTIAGRKAQQAINDYRDSLANKVVETLGHEPSYVENLPDLNKYDTGQKVAEALHKDLKAEIDPITEEYDKIRAEGKTSNFTPSNRRQTADDITKMIEEQGWHKAENEANLKVAENVIRKLPIQETANDLKNYITNLRNDNPFGSPGYQAAKRISNLLRGSEERAITEGILDRGGAHEAVSQHLENYQNLRSRYSQLMDKLDNLNEHLHVGRYDGPGSFLSNLKEMSNVNAEAVINRLSGKTKAQALEALATVSPEALKEVRQHHVDELLHKSLANGQLSPNKLMKNFDKLSPQVKDLIASKEAQETLKTIDTITERMSDLTHNWSNSARTIDKLSQGWYTPITLITALMGHEGAGLLGHLGMMGFTEGKDAVKLGMLRFLGSDKEIKSTAFKSMVRFLHNTYKGQNTINKAVSNVFEGTAKVLPQGLIPAAADTARLDKFITKMNENPGTLMQSVARNDDLGHYMPNHQTSMVETTTRAAQYLQTLKPHPTRLNPLDKPIDPTPSQQARYNRALEIAQQPAVVLQKIKDGTLQQSDMQDLGAMYPALYKQFAEKLSNQMLSNHDKSIPYKTKMSLSLFLGQPLDSTMQPNSIQASQMVFAPKQQPQQPQGKTKKGTSTLGKHNKSYATPSQAAEAAQSDRE